MMDILNLVFLSLQILALSLTIGQAMQPRRRARRVLRRERRLYPGA